ncbi:leucine-rich repeat domain-containing protein [Streptomyces antibioticus]|uniref:Gala protein n=1 Tax=Streptomyces antibioticus TaxID=1890 RepID=A0AAE6YEP3_STRAT|nr:gala protein [Streptomyces antibioticus]OOQ47970.1 gala protein [Streptomyces antibioticus]QIT48313.1 gala protein [Streptomyces antibioticus]
MTQPTPVRCPAIEHPDIPVGDPAALEPLLDRLRSARRVGTDESFPVGTLRADGRVDLCKQGLGTAGAARLLPVAAASAHATHLLLGTNTIGDDGARAVADALTDGHGLHTLYLGCNRIGPDGVTVLADALTGDDTVRALWLKRNPAGDAAARALAAALRRNTALRTLDLVNTGLTSDGLAALLDALTARPRPVERLFVGGNGLTADAAPLLAALIRDAGVRELYLPANHLGDEGAAILAAAADPARPVRLGLGGNGIGPAGARALAGSLAGIEALDLGRPMSERSLGAPANTTGDEGAHALAAALPGSPLRRLELCHTGLTGRGAKTLLAAVPDGSPLEYVGLGPGLPRKVKRSFTQRLRATVGTHPDLRAIGSVYR